MGAHISLARGVNSPEAMLIRRRPEVLAGFGPRQRQVLSLRYVDRLPIADVAARLRITPAAVRDATKTARKRLRLLCPELSPVSALLPSGGGAGSRPEVQPVLVCRAIIPGRVHAIADVDHPKAGPLAVAFRCSVSGWQVTARGGRVVADRLDKVTALALMRRVGKELAVRPSLVLRPAVRRVEVTACPF